MDADAKYILYLVCETLGINKFEIAEEIHEDEIFEDVKTLIDEIVTMCLQKYIYSQITLWL